MSEIRMTNLTINPVVIATERGLRPDDFRRKNSGDINKPSACPFCPGNESKTPPPERYRIGGQGKNWDLRIFPNMYPAFRKEGNSRVMVNFALSCTIADAHGAHEVVVETPAHDEDFSVLPIDRFRNLFGAMVHQMDDLYGDKNIRFIQIFKNHGEAAGASLEHPHTQLICMPQLPPLVADQLHRSCLYEAAHGESIFAVAIARAENDDRVVAKNAKFTCIAPYESRVPFEMWIIPLEERSRLEHSASDFYELATITSESFRRLRAALGFLPPFNVVLEENPPGCYQNAERFFRWRFTILPRLTKIAGFELGTGFYINPMPPEDAAKFLRDAKI